MQRARYFCPILIKFGVYRRIFHEIRSVATALIRADARLNVTKVGITWTTECMY